VSYVTLLDRSISYTGSAVRSSAIGIFEEGATMADFAGAGNPLTSGGLDEASNAAGVGLPEIWAVVSVEAAGCGICRTAGRGCCSNATSFTA
jgi:hypothetical protein